MISPIRLIPIVLLATLACTTTATAADKQAEAYLQAIIKANQTLKQAAYIALIELKPIMSGKEPDGPKLKLAVQNASKMLAGVAEEMRTATPPNSPEGQALAAAHAKFMQGQQQIISGEFNQLMSIALDKSKPLAQRKVELEKGLAQVATVEKQSLPPFVQAITAYTKKYGIQIQ